MTVPQNQPLADWIKPFRSPLCWVIVTHAVLFLTVLVLWSAYPVSDVLRTLDGSLVIAQLALIGIWTTLSAREAGSPFSPELIVPAMVTMMLVLPAMAFLMFHAILVGSPMWISPPIFANVLLMSLRSRGWQLKRFDCETMPPPREFQFSIRSTLLAMAFVSAIFALAAISSLFRNRQDEFSLVAILLEVAIASVVYGSAPVTAIWATLTPGRLLPRLAAAGFALGLVALLLSHDAEERAAVQIIGVPVLAGSLCVFVTTLFVLRVMRYRVVWGPPVPRLFQSLRDDSGHKPDV